MVTINTFWASSDIEAAARPGNGKLGLVAGISNKHGTVIKRLGIDGNKFVCQSGQALPCSALRGEGCAIYRWYRWSQAKWWTWEKENVLLFLHIAADLLIQILMITMTLLKRRSTKTFLWILMMFQTYLKIFTMIKKTLHAWRAFGSPDFVSFFEFWPPLNSYIIVGQSLVYEVLELTVFDFAENIGSRILLAPESPLPSSSRASLTRATRPSSPARR